MDYESSAFNHSATGAVLELVGFEPTSIENSMSNPKSPEFVKKIIFNIIFLT